MSHLVIIDGHAVIHRAYHSIPPLTHDGQPVNAIYGFYSMVLSIIDNLKPDYLVVCLDSPGPTFRNTEFVGYRAKRTAPDRDLVSQLPLLPKTLKTTGITHYAFGGYEADDLIATIARRSLRKKNIDHITIVTGDKDLMQLVSGHISLSVPVRGLSESKLYGPEEVKEKLGVLPSQVVDLKALMGDSSDNYPGVSGIGPVAATGLLAQYGHLDNIYSHLNEIKPSVSEKLRKDCDNAYLSQKLATLVDDIPLKFKIKPSRLGRHKFIGLDTLFKQYNFKSLSSRLRRRLDFKTKSETKVQSNQQSLF